MVVALKYGLKVKRLNFGLYFGFIPMFYLKIPGIYTLSRVKRIITMSAGIYINFTVTAVVGILSLWVKNEYLNSFAAANLQIAMVNLLPFTLSDGYFIITTFLKASNLRADFFYRIAAFGSKKVSKPLSDISKVYFNLSIIFFIAFAIYESYWVLKTIQEFMARHGMHITIIQFILLMLFFILFLMLLFVFIIRKRFKTWLIDKANEEE